MIRKTATIATCAFALLTGFSTAEAQRPTAPRLFSNKTLAYIRVDDSRDLKDKLSATGMGKMAADPQIGPILNTFYSTFASNIQGMQQAIGINLDELLSIPNGELAAAVIGTKESPVVAVMLEAGDEIPALEIMLNKMERAMTENGRQRTVKEVGKISIIHLAQNANEQVAYFIDSGVFVASTKLEFTENLARIWTGNGIDHKPLADNRDFTTIMGRCVGTEGERPQVSFFVDPLALVRELNKANPAAMTGMALLKPLGIDGIKAVGGSAIIAPNDFDSIIHGHLLLNPNRQGVMRVLRPKSGSTKPEEWVNDQVSSYMTANWDVTKTLKAVQDIVDTFGGENAFETNVIANVNKQMGIDFRKDFLELIDDRLTLVQLIVPPKKINSQSNIYCLHMKEASRFKNEVIPKVVEKFRGRVDWKTKQVGDCAVYFLQLDNDGRNDNRAIRLPQPAFTVLDDQFLMSDSLGALEEAIKVNSSGDDLLSDSIEFKLVEDRIKAQLKNTEVSIIAYQRPEETMRLFYDLAVNPENIDNLEKMVENNPNPLLVALLTAVRSKNLPPFEVIAKYLAPGGAFVVDEETGLHYTGFSLRRD